MINQMEKEPNGSFFIRHSKIQNFRNPRLHGHHPVRDIITKRIISIGGTPAPERSLIRIFILFLYHNNDDYHAYNRE